MDEDSIYKYDGEDIYSEKFYIVNKPHSKSREGFPLDSLPVDMDSMKIIMIWTIPKAKAWALFMGSGIFLLGVLKPIVG
jgi:8-oxo-dGTP diphosphatase